MKCNCEYERVCRYKPNIEAAIDGIFDTRFAYTNSVLDRDDEISAAVRKVCTHRDPK